jgi:hypothetical protein
VLAVDLWGARHAWSARTTTHSRTELESLLDGLEVMRLEEREGERQTVADGVQHWHDFAIIARRPV